MPANTISMKLLGADEDNGVVRFDDFRGFCDNLSQCLRKTEAIIAGGPSHIRYRIAALHTGSAAITLEAMPPANGRDYRDDTLSLFTDTVGHLQDGEAVDSRMGRDVLETFRALVTPLHRNTKEVWIEGVRLNSQYEANIENILGSSFPSHGSVSGILERVNVHNKREFFLYPPIRNYRIKCIFVEKLLNRVRSAIKGNVTVRGVMYSEQDSPFCQSK